MNGKEFAAALESIGWKKADFSRAMGVHRNSVSEWCSENGQPPVWAQRYAQLLVKLKLLALEHIEPPPRHGTDDQSTEAE